MANDSQNLDGVGGEAGNPGAYHSAEREADASRTGPPADAATRGTHVPASIAGIPGTELDAPWPLPVDTY